MILPAFWKTLYSWSCSAEVSLSISAKQDIAEVDFVANRADDRLYIQVCYILTTENTDLEFAPLEAIADNYEKLMLSTDTLLRVNRGGIRQKNIIDFLLEH